MADMIEVLAKLDHRLVGYLPGNRSLRWNQYALISGLSTSASIVNVAQVAETVPLECLDLEIQEFRKGYNRGSALMIEEADIHKLADIPGYRAP